MNLVSFTKLAFAQGGGSLHIHNGSINPSSGYMVATEGNEAKIKINPRLKHELKQYELTKKVFQYLADTFDNWHDNNDIYLGLWLNEKDGLWYIDLSEHYKHFEVAVKVGLERKQIAICDCNTSNEVKL